MDWSGLKRKLDDGKDDTFVKVDDIVPERLNKTKQKNKKTCMNKEFS